MNWLEPLVWGLTAVASVPLLTLAVECMAAARRPGTTPPPVSRPRCAVLIPAHNEEPVLAVTLRTVLPQLADGDRVLVVADNCTDRTAEIARGLGAEVAERTNMRERGKGYALAFGIERLAADPPDVVVIVDADCRVGDGTLGRLVAAASATGRPVQGAYRMDLPPGAGPKQRLAACAFTVKNVVRPLGLQRLGLPCLLTGTGMAFPWPVIRSARLGHGHIVEDMQLAVELAATGHPPRFLYEADVRGEFPVSPDAQQSQRRRWEHGHVQVLATGVPRLLVAAVRTGRPSLLGMASELAVPPLSALFACSGVTLLALLTWSVVTSSWAATLTFVGVGMIAVFALISAYWAHGQSLLSAADLVRIPAYALGKLPLYSSLFTRRQEEWVRTART